MVYMSHYILFWRRKALLRRVCRAWTTFLGVLLKFKGFRLFQMHSAQTASTTHSFNVLISQSSISCLWFNSVHAPQCLCVTNRTSTEYKHRWGFPEQRKPLKYLELDCIWPHYSFWWQAHFLITSQCYYSFFIYTAMQMVAYLVLKPC